MDFLKTVKSISGKKGLLRVVLVWISWFENSGRRSNKFLEDLKGGSGLLTRVCATLKFIPKENRAGQTSTQELS